MKSAFRVPEDVAALAMGTLVLGTLAGELLQVDSFRIAAEIASLSYVFLTVIGTGWTGRIFATLSGWGIVGVVFVSPTALNDLDGALNRACFVVTLFVALGFLREAAQSSRMVQRCGRFLARQLPGRRYAALTLGGHLFGLVLNYGAISLLGTMSARSNHGEKDELVRRLRLQRMLLAVQRGFISTLTWSPLSLSTAVTLSVLPSLQWSSLVPFTLIAGFGLIYLGWQLDRLFKSTGRTSSMAAQPVDGNWWLLLPMALLVATVVAAAMAVKAYFDVPMVVGVMVSVPLIAMIWIYVQLTSRGSIRALRLAIRRYRRHVRGAFPSYRNEVALLWSAAVIGGTAAVLLEPFIGGGIEDFIALAPWALPMSCLWLVVIAGQLGMNPILTVTILGSLMPDVTAFGIPAVAIAVGITGGWALTGASSPFTATTVLVGRISGARPIAVGLQWNGVYTIIGGALISFYVTMLALFLGGPNGG